MTYSLVVEEVLVFLLSDCCVECDWTEVLIAVFLLCPLDELLGSPDQQVIHINQGALVELPHVSPQLLKV